MKHKDGLTASCPHFEERKSYLGGHWIKCRMGTKAFGSTWERNLYYKEICCRKGSMCELIEIKRQAKPITKRRGPKDE